MAITITGYRATATVSSFANRIVTATTAAFTVADFTVGRRADLFTSAGVLKGIANVRQCPSTTTLEIDGAFIDRATGVAQTVNAGDIVRVAKVPSEIVTTGFAVSNNLITITDNDVTFGTAGDQTSCGVNFEGYEIIIQNGSTAFINFQGGVVTFGKLESYALDLVSADTWFDFRSGNQSTIRAMGTSAHVMFYGGGARGNPNILVYIGGNRSTPTMGAGTLVFNGFQNAYDFICPADGNGAWINPSRHQLINVKTSTAANQAISIRWSNGVIRGGTRKVARGSRRPLAIYGSAFPTQTLGGKDDSRVYINDLGGADGTGGRAGVAGSGSVFHRQGNATVIAIDVYNHVVPFYMASSGWGVAGADQTPVANNNVTMQIRYANTISNIAEGSVAVIERADTRAIADSLADITTGSWLAEVRRKTVVGTTDSNVVGAWKLGVKCYGKTIYNNDIAVSTVTMDTGVTGEDVSFRQVAVQLPDTGVTLATSAEALALSSKFTINAGTQTITVTGNGNLDELYDYAVAWNCANATNAVIPTLERYPLIYEGTSLFAPTGWTIVVNNGVTLAAGTKYDFVSFPTVTLTGSGQITAVYSSNAGTSTVWQFQNVAVGSSLVIYNSSGTTLYYRDQVTSAGDYAYYIPPGTTGTYTWAIERYGFQRQSGTFAANTGGLLFYVPIYVEDVGITETTKATVAAYTEIENSEKFYDYTAYFRLGEQGIKIGQMVTRSGTSIEVQSGLSHVIRKTSSIAVYAVTGGVITTKAEVYAGTTKYSTEILVPPATLTAHTNEVITIAIEDSNGNSSVNIQASGDNEFEIWKITNATDPDDYATGTLLDTVGIGVYRFISAPGFKMVIRDTTTNFRVVSPMEKGNYEAALFFGAAVQLAQAPEVTQINTKVDILQNSLEEVQAKTDGLTFTIPNVLDANIQYVNDIEVKGTGEDNDPWNPV